MRKLLAALLFSTAALACTKASDVAPAPTATTDPAPAPNGGTIPVDPTPVPSGGTASATPPPAPSAAVAADATPDLVEAAPGVQVVADYDAPVFFSAGMYWRYNDHRWYSSSGYTGDWEYRASPPSVIVSLDRPERFVHYRPSGYVVRHRPAPQRAWHPVEVHGEVRVDPRADVHVELPRAQVHVEAPRAQVHVEAPRAQVRVEVPRVDVRIAPPRAEVRVDPHAEVHIGR